MKAIFLITAAMAAVIAPAAWAAPSIAVSGPSAPVNTSGSVQLSATLTELSGPVMWSVNGVAGGNTIVGTITSAGMYKAPAMPPNPNVVTVSASAMGVTGAAPITVVRPKISVASFTPYALSTGAFVLSVGGSNFAPDMTIELSGLNTTTTYSNPWGAKVSGTVPAGMKANTYITVTLPGPGGNSYTSGTAIAINGGPGSGSGGGSGGGSGVTVSVTPAITNVPQGATAQFNAAVSGNANTAVTWSVSGGGTISAAGLFTAPASVPNPPTATVTATSVADNTKSASAAVTITAPQAAPVISALAPAQLPFGAFSLTINGTGFSNSSVSIGGVNIPATTVSATQITCTGVSLMAWQGQTVNVVVTNSGAGGMSSAPKAIPVGVAGAAVSAAAAMRFLDQAAFGAKPAEVVQVQQMGMQAWLNAQYALPTTQLFATPGGYTYDSPARFFSNAVNAQDQVRQKVAFALSQLFVVTLSKLNSPDQLQPYQQMLYENAFTSYPNLLKKVTLHPGMGWFLDMVNNDKANPVTGSVANENYAREILQLFSIGMVQLSQNGTPVLVNGKPVPTYTQNDVTEFARVFTGWSFGPLPGQPNVGHNSYNFKDPMVSWDPYHDSGSKKLLNGLVLPAGQTAVQDMDAALANIAGHANVAPFFSKYMIQHLVTSNPSAQYVQDVAGVFTSSGGDMKALVSAILLHPEARSGDNGQVSATFGHLQEPILYVANIMRAMNGVASDDHYFSYDLTQLGQNLYDAPSVFNYYSPLYRLPGGIPAPEFQIHSPWAAVRRINLIDSWFGAYQGTTASYGSGATINLNPWIAMAANPATLVEALDTTFTRGQMPATMKTQVLNAVTATSGDLRRVQIGTYLIVTSAFYAVMH